MYYYVKKRTQKNKKTWINSNYGNNWNISKNWNKSKINIRTILFLGMVQYIKVRLNSNMQLQM